MVFKDINQIENYKNEILVFAGYFTGKFLINILSSSKDSIITLPAEFDAIKDRISFVNEKFNQDNIVERAIAIGADSLGICIDEVDNVSEETYGITQDKILANKEKLPIYCLPASASL